jgi:hypothetical protein
LQVKEKKLMERIEVESIITEFTEEKGVFKSNCNLKHRQLEHDRSERGKTIEKLDNNIEALKVCINSKFTKIFMGIIVILLGVITTGAFTVLTYMLSKK